MPAVELNAAWVPLYADPDHQLSFPVTVPSGSETGTWTARVWGDDRKATLLATVTGTVTGQVVTLTWTATQIDELVSAGNRTFAGWWELDRTVAAVAIPWFKGPFIIDPKHRVTGTTTALTVTVVNSTVTVTGGELTMAEVNAAITAVDLADLADVNGTVAASGQVLTFDGTSWGPSTAAGSMTGGQILTTLSPVDGPGSGLDADTVDGVEAASFVRDTGDETVAGIKTFSATPVVPDASWTVLKGGTGASTIDGARDNLALLSPGSPMFEGVELRQFRAAMANRKTAPLTVLQLGDSNGVGYYSTTVDDPWARVAPVTLQTSNGQRPDVGYVPRHSLTNYLHSWTTSGSLTEVATSGLGYAAVGPAANGGYIETTQVCDRLWIRYTAGNLIGQFTVSIDGGAGVVVPFISGTIAGGYTWDSGPLSRGSHTVRITSSDATFPCRIEGVYFFDGNGNSTGAQGALSAANSLTGTGIRWWNGAKFGTRAGHFAASSATTWWTDGLDRINPDLVIMAWGTNEITAGTTTAQFKTDLAGVVSRINTVMAAAGRPNPSYAFVVPHGTGANDATFLPYRTAIIEAAATAGAALIDRYGLAGYVGTSTADVWGITATLDGATRVHLSTRGHRLVGESVADWVLRAASVRPAGVDDTNAVPYWQLPAATTSLPGSMSAADKTKVDGLGALATATTLPAVIGVACSDETTVITTGTAKATFRMPHAMTLTGVRAGLTTVSSSGVVTVDINEGGTTILSTKLTIDQAEKTSTTAATPAVFSDSVLADDAEITVDIDGAGTGATGLKVFLIGTRATS